jgi:hypothetical protein
MDQAQVLVACNSNAFPTPGYPPVATLEEMDILY